MWNSYPENYTVFDTETTGVDPALYLIVEYGWHITRKRKTCDNDAVLINWVGHYGITYEWLKARMDTVREKMAARGLNYRFTPEMLMEHGIPAPQAVEHLTTSSWKCWNAASCWSGITSSHTTVRNARRDVQPLLQLQADRVARQLHDGHGFN